MAAKDDHQKPSSDTEVQTTQSLQQKSFREYLKREQIAFMLVPLFVIALSLFMIVISLQKLRSHGDPPAAGNIQPPKWLVEWLNSQEVNKEGSQKLNLQCKKVPAGGNGQAWSLRCEHVQEVDQQDTKITQEPQSFYLQLDKSQGESNLQSPQWQNSLCCRPCSYKPPPSPAMNIIPDSEPQVPVPVPSLPVFIITTIIKWVKVVTYAGIHMIRTLITWVPTPFIPIKCQYHSETLSVEFEMELKKMLQAELRRQLQVEASQQQFKPCLDKFPKVLRTRFETKFKDILTAALEQISQEGTAYSHATTARWVQESTEVTEHKQISVEESTRVTEQIFVGESVQETEHKQILEKSTVSKNPTHPT
ncbi:hypothetical protein P3X46_024360 [Hevea brasiliensis]|uniref:Uncharacterized protein n=1 Tax=Hevea brasiliensis TaxID=3981 RepID=A0ABQ9L285_HEVBR|nr:hypothetical protein P3X46_024360 [Hevea brasiliensis]